MFFEVLCDLFAGIAYFCESVTCFHAPVNEHSKHGKYLYKSIINGFCIPNQKCYFIT